MPEKLAGMLAPHRYRIIDGHCHVGPHPRLAIAQSSPAQLVAAMDRVGVECAAVSPLSGLAMDAEGANAFSYRMTQKYPGRFLAMALFDGNRKERVVPELERCVDSFGMRIIKIHPVDSHCPMDRSVYQRVYAFAQERRLAILNHDWQDWRRLASLAERYPAVRFAQAHVAGKWDGRSEEPYLELARETPNVYLDICSSQSYYGCLEKLVAYVGADKIFFGSDVPLLNLAYGVGKVLLSQLTPKEKQAVLADTFLRFIHAPSSI